MLLTGGQAADIKRSLELVQGEQPLRVIADKAYDADWFVHYLDSENIEAVIPPKTNRQTQRIIDYKVYKERNVIERTINRLKQYRKIATRYEKTATSFLALCSFVASFINLSL